MFKRSRKNPSRLRLFDIKTLFLMLLAAIPMSLAATVLYSGVSSSNINYQLLAQKSQKANTQDKVLGESHEPQIFIVESDGTSFTGGGVITLAGTSEPAIEVGSYGVGGIAKIELYEASENDLLDYLLHDKDYKKIKSLPDPKGFRPVINVEQEIKSGWGKEAKVVLPLAENGVYFFQIFLGNDSASGYLLRSTLGTLLKEGDNEYIFWGQDLKTRRSVSSGTIKIFNLEGSKKVISTTAFNNDGIAKSLLSADADVAIVESGKSLALVPINLRYLNGWGSYKTFKPKEVHSKYFIFTDRPIYRPGDTVYFKAILRDDDDARYTITQGNVVAKIYKDWDEKQAIFEKNFDISLRGTIFGEAKIPADSATGYYQLKVSIPQKSTDYYWENNTISFQVEYFRKPEYRLDIDIGKSEFIAGDKSSFTISGNYFSGQPLVNAEVTYKITSSDFYEYEYLADHPNVISDDYRWGYYGASTIREEKVALNDRGEAEVNLETVVPSDKNQSQVFSIEAKFDNGSGNPVSARKNILVYKGEYGIFRKDYSFGTRVGTPVTLPLVLSPYRNANVSGISLTAKVKREYWEPYQEPDKKHPSYRKIEEEITSLSGKTDQKGETTLKFTPQKVGSYIWTVEGTDSRGNHIVKTFYSWVADLNQPLYTGVSENELTIKTDRAKYQPGASILFTIFSQTPDRDVFLSLERDRVNRFQIVHMQGKSATLEVSTVGTDVPNIFASATSFSERKLDRSSINVTVSPQGKRLLVDITPDKKVYGPSETVTLNIKTSDTAGNPLAADLAVWAVDKAIFELSDAKPASIFDTFWSERYNNTQESHSLEGISVSPMGGRGGCFAEGTEVLMSDYTVKTIEKIKKGDTILTRKSEKDSSLVKVKVKNIHSTSSSGILIINGKLEVTPNHKLWVNNSWKQAGDIVIGDILSDSDNRPVTVSSIEWQRGNFPVYNLEIDNYHTYFAQGIWVHNEKGEGGGRSVFKDTAYWNPEVKTDSLGRAQVRFNLPDNLTTWVIAAVGVTADTRVGQTTGEITVSKDIIVRPILPNIMRPGDKMVVSALVQNFTEQPSDFDVDLTFNFRKVEEATHAGVPIKQKETKQLYWKITPSKENEKAVLSFSARSTGNKKLQDTITVELPIRPFGFWEKRAEVGNGEISYNLKLNDDADREKSQVSLSLSPTLIGTLSTAVSYLIGYPYGCVEQTTSRFVPAVIAKSNPDIFASVLSGKNIDDMIKEGVMRLRELQHTDGGWSWWFSPKSDIFTTAYVVEYLILAKQAGASVDDNILSSAQRFLEQDGTYNPATSQYEKLTGKDEIAVKTYALSLLGSNRGTALLTDFSGVSADILSMIVMANIRNGNTNPKSNGLSELLSMGKTQGDGVYWEGGDKLHFGSQDASTAWAIRAITSGGDKETALKASRFLGRNRRFEYWSNTYATAQVVRALIELAKTTSELSPNFQYTVTLDSREIARGSISDAKTEIKDVIISISDLKKTDLSQIAIHKQGEGQLYSTLLTREFHTDRNSKAINHGLNIKREYINSNGGNTITVGDEVTVKLTVSGLTSEEYYGVIADELPAGLIPINTSLKNEQYDQKAGSFDYYDVSGREVTENGTILSLYRVPAGEKTYTYKARAVTQGTFSAPPATVSLMYAPEIYGRSEAQVVNISGKSEFPYAKRQEVSPTKAKETPKEIRIAGIKVTTNILLIGVGLALALFVVAFLILKKLKH